MGNGAWFGFGAEVATTPLLIDHPERGPIFIGFAEDLFEVSSDGVGEWSSAGSLSPTDWNPPEHFRTESGARDGFFPMR